MSSTSQTHAPQPAPWRSAFLEHVSKLESPEFVFSSLHPAPTGQHASPTPFVPRARFVIFRGMWAELPENKHNSAEQNERVYESDMPTFTTDVRMGKPLELFASSAGRAEEESQVQGSGGGGPCEAVWWIKEVGMQWRVRGTAFVVAPDIEGESGEGSSGVRTVKSEVGGRMRVVKEEGREAWSWKRELRAHFGNMSPGLRGTYGRLREEAETEWMNADLVRVGSFRAPPPGQPVDKPYDEKNLKLGEKVEDLDDPIARENFRLVVIKPDEVESVDLSDPGTARRQVYKLDASDGSWSQQECWP